MDWKQTADAVGDALNALDEARQKFGEDSPEALVADEQALSALRAHESTDEH